MSALESALKRSRNELEAAQHLVAGGFARQATSRAYGEADYAGVTMSVAEAESAITDAARFVNAVDAWLKERSG